MPESLRQRKVTRFVLWRPIDDGTVPYLIIGQFRRGNPPTLINLNRFALQPAPAFPDLWEIAAADCRLVNGQTYYYWFEVGDTAPGHALGGRIMVTDPSAYMVDWRLRAPANLPASGGGELPPAAVIHFQNGELVACDSDSAGGPVDFSDVGSPDTLSPNNRLVIYELPTAWTVSADGVERGIGTFRDVTALIDPNINGVNFPNLDVTRQGRSYLTDLGINALELLPPADSYYRREWGYGTTNFFAPDFDLGFPDDFSFPSPNAELAQMVRACHQYGIRFFVDMVLGMCKEGAYQHINFAAFHIDNPGDHLDDPDAWTSQRGGGNREWRNGWGSTLIRYAGPRRDGFDPVTGNAASTVSARQWICAALQRWMIDFHVDGIRLDSIETVANWDFIEEFKTYARALWVARWQSHQLPGNGDDRFLVVGEELSLPWGLLTGNRLEGLWNKRFMELIRCAILGRNGDGEPSFEWTVRRAIDCRILGFSRGTQAIIYLTSHDVEGYRNERLFNYLNNNGVWDTEKRIKLAFVCLLTAVGVPMILAGEEFADQHDRFDQQGNVTQDGGKQVDPVNFSRSSDPWRQRIFRYVSQLIALRTTHNALSVDDIAFIHVDFSERKRVMVWQRGAPQHDPVVVVANFSDFTSDVSRPDAEYVISNWPATPAGRVWREITQNRAVPPGWVGREPIFAWEAKVYTLA